MSINRELIKEGKNRVKKKKKNTEELLKLVIKSPKESARVGLSRNLYCFYFPDNQTVEFEKK